MIRGMDMWAFYSPAHIYSMKHNLLTACINQ